MSEELKPAAVHDANVFLPGSLGPVRREVVLAYEHDRVVGQLRAELAAIKAGQGETWKCSSCGATSGAICNENGCFENERSAPPASADAVSVPRELLERLCGATQQSVVSDLATLRTLYVQRMKATDELRALLAQSESKGMNHE